MSLSNHDWSMIIMIRLRLLFFIFMVPLIQSNKPHRWFARKYGRPVNSLIHYPSFTTISNYELIWVFKYLTLCQIFFTWNYWLSIERGPPPDAVPQECPTRVSQECSRRVLQWSVLQMCLSRVLYKSVPQKRFVDLLNIFLKFLKEGTHIGTSLLTVRSANQFPFFHFSTDLSLSCPSQHVPNMDHVDAVPGFCGSLLASPFEGRAANRSQCTKAVCRMLLVLVLVNSGYGCLIMVN